MRPDGSDRVDIAGTRPVFSPNGNWLAYLDCSGASCDLYVAHADGRQSRLIDTGIAAPFSRGEPAWSSDSKKLVYVKAPGESIWEADRHSDRKTEVLRIAAIVSAAVFFPDDDTITYIADFPARLFSISIGATQPSFRRTVGDIGYLVESPTDTTLAAVGSVIGPGSFILAFDAGFAQDYQTPPNAFAPVWAPDGSLVAHAFCDRTTQAFPGGPCAIQVVDSNGSSWSVYRGPAVEGSDWVRGYDWSPESSRLVLSVSTAGGPFRLSTVNADGSGLAPLLSGPGAQFEPAWQSGAGS